MFISDHIIFYLVLILFFKKKIIESACSDEEEKYQGVCCRLVGSEWLSYIFKVTVFIEMLELILNAVFIIEDSHDIFFSSEV